MRQGDLSCSHPLGASLIAATPPKAALLYCPNPVTEPNFPKCYRLKGSEGLGKIPYYHTIVTGSPHALAISTSSTLFPRGGAGPTLSGAKISEGSGPALQLSLLLGLALLNTEGDQGKVQKSIIPAPMPPHDRIVVLSAFTRSCPQG